jgi:quercetin dioxygenase-like cupin family protein
MLIHHLRDGEFGSTVVDHWEPAMEPVLGKPCVQSHTIPARSVYLRNFSETMRTDWHTPSQRQLIVVLSGQMSVTHSTGESVVRAGEILFADDLAGRGHLTTCLPGERLHIEVPLGVNVSRLLGGQ